MSEPVTASDKRARLERIALLSAVVAAAGFASAGAHAACSPWNSSTAYTAGNTVTENGVTYKANWWTQGNDPAHSNGASGTGQPWTITSSCGTTPPPPPPAPNPPPPTPTPPPPSSCLSSAWQRGINYPLGAVVLYTANGSYYKVVNVGTNGSDGTDPTISTWYWQPTTCTGGGSTPPPPPPPPPPAPAPSCSSSTWQAGINYAVGTVVLYPANGSYYKEVNAGSNGSDGTDPTISTWYWQPTTCSSGGGGGGTGGSFVVSEAQFNQMFPSRNGLYSYAGLINAMGAYPAFAHTGSDTTQKQEAAAFLANVAEESDSLRATREYNTANWPLYCDTSNGNTCAPGQTYEGRGPLQLSWNYNYRAAGNAIGVDIWSNPDLVATDSTITWKTAVWYWMTGTGNAGTTPHNAMVNGQGFGTTIRAINGSVECNGGNPAEVQTRINFYNSFTSLIGVTPGGNLGC